MELGPNDIAKKQTLSARRDTGVKAPLSLSNIAKEVSTLLENIQSDMFNKAKATYDSRLQTVTEWKDLVPALDNKCVAVIPWCEVEACEDDIKERSGKSYVVKLHLGSSQLTFVQSGSAGRAGTFCWSQIAGHSIRPR